MRSTKSNVIFLLMADIIWGAAFVAQSTGGAVIGAYSFNCIRSLMGALVLVPVILLMDRLGISTNRPHTREEKRTLWRGGIICGVALCFASNFQQLGINMGSTVGKAGFLTACYIIMVPILGIFLKKKCSWNVGLGVVLTLMGLYLLCMEDSFSLTLPDVLLLLCALCFAVQILSIDHFAPLVDGVRLSCIEFLVSGSISLIPMFFVDMKHSASGIAAWAAPFADLDVWIPLLYAGVCSCGIAYTFQIFGQRNFNPTVASLIMSMESVFSIFFGWLLLHETLSVRELLGCGAILIAIVIAQLDFSGLANRKSGCKKPRTRVMEHTKCNETK